MKSPSRICSVAVAFLLALPALADVVDPPPEGSFTFVVLPDTQNYTIAAARREIFLSQTQWVADHKDSFNIKCVLHEGDIVENNIAPQWDLAREAFNILDAAGVPYALAPGNHDYGPGGNGQKPNTLFNEPRYFGVGSSYPTQSSFGGTFEEGKTDNSYHTFKAGGLDWIVLALEWRPRPSVIAWADKVLGEHADHTAILVTHEYLGASGFRTGTGNTMWSGLVSKHNMAFVFCGHVLGSARLTSVGTSGHVTHQILANYQHLTLGGNGFLRLVHITPDTTGVRILTYSPFLDAVMENPVEQFPLVQCGVPEDPAQDVDRNRVPDECEPDCNGNAVPDAFELRRGDSPDANGNGIPDECDVRPAFTVLPEIGQEPLQIQVDASATVTQEGHAIVSYRWDFGDGISAEGQAGTHTYSNAGSFTISLAATDDRALTGRVSRRALVRFRSEDVAPWTSADVGDPAFPGGGRFEGDCLVVFAGGRRLTTADDDQLHFLYQELAGGFVFTARLAELVSDSTGATVGLMVRESLDPGAPHASVVFRDGSTAARVGTYRRSAASERARWKSGGNREAPNGWLRLERQGDLFFGSVSADGESWTDLEPVTVPMPEVVLAGIVATAVDTRDNLYTVNARACEVRITRDEFLRGDADASGKVEPDDGIFLISYLFLEAVPPSCLDAGDGDDNGKLNLVDSIAIFQYLFAGGAAPPEPGPVNCGSDPSADDLGCRLSACP